MEDDEDYGFEYETEEEEEEDVAIENQVCDLYHNASLCHARSS